MISYSKAADLPKKLEEVAKQVEVTRGNVLDISEKGSLRAFSPADMPNVRKGAIDNRGIDVTDWDLQAQVLPFLLNEIKPPQSQATH